MHRVAGGHHKNQDQQQPQPQQQQQQQQAPPLQSEGSAGGYAGQGACRIYSEAELSEATENFAPSNRVGRGGFGSVFRGTLDGVPVAVKVMDVGPDAMQARATRAVWATRGVSSTPQFSVAASCHGRLPMWRPREGVCGCSPGERRVTHNAAAPGALRRAPRSSTPRSTSSAGFTTRTWCCSSAPAPKR